ncbi:MAG: hypothetical protein F6J95_001800 [Leptolyngbya sp. SIO1E4]|nr:hypothetical protein [Leptolyngbya sp. SIO1E4]
MSEPLLQRYWTPPQETIELLELHQIAHEFRQEQAHREAWQAYCRHYEELAQQHQQDHAAMQAEPNLFAFFWKKRGKA